MILQINKPVTIIIFVILLFTIIVLSRALLLRNKRIKKIITNYTDKTFEHKENLFKLIKIDTPTFIEGKSYNEFKKEIEKQFPLIHTFFVKEKIGGNSIYTYKTNIENAPTILFSSYIDYNGNHQNAYIKDDLICGNGTFDSKSLLYVTFRAVEDLLREKEKLDVNLTLVVTNDDEANKDGLKKIISLFLKKGVFFNLVIEEGSGIIDPELYNLRSNYALIGLGVSGQIKLRFESKKKESLVSFISEINKPHFFKMRIDNKSIKVLGNVSKDMVFRDRFFLNNAWLFRLKTRKIIETKYHEIDKMLKTTVNIKDIEENDGLYFTDMEFELSTHDKPADILLQVDDLMEKLQIDYKILDVKEGSRITKTYNYGYKLVKDAINKVFNEVYIAPVIVNKISEKRYFDKVSDCVIRFSPLYYDLNAYNSSTTDRSYIDSKSLENGIEFYKYILENYKIKAG